MVLPSKSRIDVLNGLQVHELMDLRTVLSGIELLRFQPPGEDREGPIAPVLRELSEDSSSGGPKSIIGQNVAQLIRKHGVWVSFLPIGGVCTSSEHLGQN